MGEIGDARNGQVIRTFDTGATRNNDAEQPDYEGFLSPLVVRRFGQYMHKHRHQADGRLRASDNWTAGIPLDAYAKSLLRHMEDFWLTHRGYPELSREPIEETLCAIIFNAQGYLFEILSDPSQLAEVQNKMPHLRKRKSPGVERGPSGNNDSTK